MELTLNQLKKLIEEKVDIVDILYRYNPSGHYQAGQTCFCPFHDNENTPAASIYNNDGITSLYCFSERRLYTSADAIEILLKKDMYSIAEKLWARMPDTEKQKWIVVNSNESFEDAFSLNRDDTNSDTTVKKARADFKNRKITVKDLLESIILGGNNED